MYEQRKCVCVCVCVCMCVCVCVCVCADNPEHYVCADQPWTLYVFFMWMCVDQPRTLRLLFIWRAARIPWPASREHDTGTVAAICCSVEGHLCHPFLQALPHAQSFQLVGLHWNYEQAIGVVFHDVHVCHTQVYYWSFLSENDCKLLALSLTSSQGRKFRAGLCHD